MSEIEQTKQFLEASNHTGLKNLLQKHLENLEAASATTSNVFEKATPAVSSAPASTPVAAPAPAPKAAATIVSNNVSNAVKYKTLDDVSWESGSYDSPTITVYLGLPGVIAAKSRTEVKFGQYSVDVTVMDLDGVNYRYINDNLEKDIIPESSKIIVKNNKIIIKLAKVKGEYSYENWNQLTCKKKRDINAEKKSKADPQSSIMDLMKNLYDEGDPEMKKVIGESMLKSRNGEKPEPPPMPDL